MARTATALAQAGPGGEPGLTEDQFVELVFAHSLDARVAESEQALGRAERVGVGSWPNPSLGWEREAVPESPGTSQDIVFASIPLVLSGRLGLEQDAAEQRARAAEARADRARAELHHEAIRAFNAVLGARERRAILEASLTQLAELTRAVEVQERAGAASGYDKLRMDLERSAVQTALRGSRAEELRAIAGALRLLGRSAETLPSLRGPIAVNRELPRLPVLLAALDQKRADVRALELEAQAAGTARRAASRSWVPEPTLNAGVQWIDSGAGTDTGYVVGVSVPLPFFERRQGEQARAAASIDLAEARRAALLHSARAHLVAAFDELALLREQLAQHQAEVVAKAQELRRIAAAGYRGGASEMLVLVDAERAARDAQLAAVELAAAVAAAENDLLFVSGAYDTAHRERTVP